MNLFSITKIMEPYIEIQVQARDDDASLQPLLDFFKPIGAIKVERDINNIRKSFGDPITIKIFLSATWQLSLEVGIAWAIERFVLDPLADEIGSWVNGLNSLSQNSSLPRDFSVEIFFKDGHHPVNFQGVSDNEQTKDAWNDIKKVVDVQKRAFKHNIVFDKVSIRYDETEKPLVVGFIKDQPAYALHLPSKHFESIEETESELNSDFFMLNVYMNKVHYLTTIQKNGYEIDPEELVKFRKNVSDLKERFLCKNL